MTQGKTTTTLTMNNSTAKVLIVDDHPAVREALAQRISRQAGLEVCGEAAGLAEAMQVLEATNPDVAVVDISLKDGNGLDLIKRIKDCNDHVLILVWSMYDASAYAERALRAGARGYINKEQATDQIINAIHQVLEGKVYLSESMPVEQLNRALVDGHASTGLLPSECLSDRELEAFQLFGQGFSTREIAVKMQISAKTVETFRARIKDKLNLGSHNDLIRRAVEWVLQNT
jgi:DNA-binding NarL/FixJ family response regulator